jgi:hypothetical protein
MTTTKTLANEFKTLKAISTPAVMKCVFGNLEGYIAARKNDSYEDYLTAINNMMNK